MSTRWTCRNILLLVVVPIVIAIVSFPFLSNTTTTTINSLLIVTPPPTDYGDGNMFNKIASRYDTINRILALGMDISWRQRMVQIIVDRVLTVNDPESSKSDNNIETTPTSNTKDTRYIVDYATGTADVAILLAKEIQKRSSTTSSTRVQIVGVDPSEQMIAIGRQKIRNTTSFFPTPNDDSNKSANSLSIQIELYISDTQNLTHFKQHNPQVNNNNNSNNNNDDDDHNDTVLYDAATMAFGIRNVPNRERALCEIYSTLKPNATFCILEFSEPSYQQTDPILHKLLSIMAKTFIRYIIPILGGILSGHFMEYMHLQNSIKEFPSPNEFITMIQQLQCPYHDDEERNNNINTNDDDTVTITRSSKAYEFDDLVQMNFGSVQLYVFRTLPSSDTDNDETTGR